MKGSGWENKLIALTGTRAPTLHDLLPTISALLGRQMRLKTVSEDEYVATLAARRVSPGSTEYLRQWATTYPALMRGECAQIDLTLRELLGREPTPVEETLRDVLGISGDSGGRGYEYVAAY